MTTTPPADEKTPAVDEEAQGPPRPQPPMTMHVYPPTQSFTKLKRRQVKNACTNCKKVCKKCDDVRPCLRCVRYGISDNCVDSPRKPRLRVKRGPYKRKEKGGNVNQGDIQESIQTASVASAIQPEPAHAQAAPTNICGSCPPFGYPENFFNHFPPTSPQVESVDVCTPVTQPYSLASVPEFQSYVHPVHGRESHTHTPQAYYTYVFPSVYYHPGQ